MNAIERLWGKVRALFVEEQAREVWGEERAVAMNQIWQTVDAQLWAMDGFLWLNDLYDDNGQLVALISNAGKLYRAPVTIDGTDVLLGAMQEIEIQFAPARQRGRLWIQRQTDGRYRWFAIAETSVLNRVGEIDSDALFDSFIANAPTEGYPVLDFFHDDRMNFGQGDYLAREGHVLLASGLLDAEHPLAQAYIDASEQGRGIWGTSVSFLPTEPPANVELVPGVTVPVYQAGILRKIAVLPEDQAASWFTAIGLEVNRMRKETEDALKVLFGDEAKATAFIEQVEATNRAITDGQLITREGEGTTETPAPETPTETPPAQPQEVEITDDLLSKITALVPAVDLAPLQAAIEELKQGLAGLTTLQADLAAVRQRLVAVEASDEDKRKKWQADLPARQTTKVTYRPRDAQPTEGAKPGLAEIADQTLAKLPK